jgi:HD-like signal output (HDOD) protein
MFREQNPNPLAGRRVKPEMAAPRHFLWRLLADHLPRLPFWMQQLNGVLKAGTIDLMRAVELVETEPVFRAEFIRICRLAELPSSDDRLDNFLVLLGGERSRTVAVGAFLTSYLAVHNACLLTEFARRSDRLGSMACRLALSSGEIDAAEAYVAGLVHHAGTLPLLHTIDPNHELSSAWLEFTVESLTTQWLLFGTDTIELGQAIALLWDYPPALQQSLRVSLEPVEDVPNTPLACIIRAADQLCAAGLAVRETYFDASIQEAVGSFVSPRRPKILPFNPDR